MEAILTKKESDVLEMYWRTLSTLSSKLKLGLATRLTAAVFEEETSKPDSKQHRVAKVKRMAVGQTDAELNKLFAGKCMPELPAGDASWQDIISANSGRTIKSIEKWL